MSQTVGKLKSLFLIFTSFLCIHSELVGQSILKEGDPAPDFNLKGVDGKNYTLESFSDHDILVVIFTCNHCPTAQAYEEKIKKLVDDYSSKRVGVVAISSNDPLAIRLDELGYTDLSDSFEEMRIRAKEHHFNFPYLYDGKTQSVAQAYGAQATPHVFILDRNRKIRYQGRFDDTEKPGVPVRTPDVMNAIEALLAGRKIDNPVTKTFGCSMKYSDKRYTVEDEKKKWATETVTLQPIDMDGIKELLANNTDKLRFINVWATWCGPCVSEFPDLLTIYRMYRGRDFEFITLSMDDPERPDRVEKFLKNRHASATNYHFVGDDKYKMMETLSPEWQGALPFSIIIEPGGKVIYSKQGIIDPFQVKKIIVENPTIGRYY